jgi:hypothetical protein
MWSEICRYKENTYGKGVPGQWYDRKFPFSEKGENVGTGGL